ncbi:unnamed protein product [Macrosiphum euphorbiae]|uniref:Uncharacterized protein n=1 Tax=Macrosiphum euphorbiae TaxID=13131 RepID=A0AAV0VTZ0_9HEMI|nr:unnamed protein product [Macrosiphum euphorbiae]
MLYARAGVVRSGTSTATATTTAAVDTTSGAKGLPSTPTTISSHPRPYSGRRRPGTDDDDDDDDDDDYDDDDYYDDYDYDDDNDYDNGGSDGAGGGSSGRAVDWMGQRVGGRWLRSARNYRTAAPKPL